MKKSMLLLVPFMMLVGCAINGLNPFGVNDVTGGAGGLATMTIQVLEPGKGSIDVDELPIVKATFSILDVMAQTQTTNWIPGAASTITFKPIKAGLTTMTLRDIDNLNWTNTTATNITVKGGFNYRIVVTLGGGIYMIETNASVATVSNYLAMYSESHVLPVLNNVFGQGANLLIWTPSLALTQITTSPWEGSYNWQLTRTASTSNWIGMAITSTNGSKDKSIYAGGHLRMAIKAFNSNNTYKVGMISIVGAATNNVSVNLASVPGYVVDGQWHALSIPMSDFAGINFTGINTYFYIASIALQTNTNTALYLDDIYYSRD